MKVYTKGGDKGSTSLIGGERVSKCDVRVEAYGTVDELTAFTALLADKLAGCDALAGSVAALPAEAAQYLEQAIDAMQECLPAITKFTIPGGDERISMCHVCRTVCRRAERAALRAAAQHKVDADVLIYLNRLSDYFYVLGRAVTVAVGAEEILWIP